MTFFSQVRLCLFVLLFVFSIPDVLSAISPDVINETSGGNVFLFSICVHIALIIYFYLSKKFNVFVLPLSHVIFPFLFFCFMSFMWRYSTIWRGIHGPWQGYVFLLAVFYFLPIAVITLIISVIIYGKNYTYKDEDEDMSHQ